MLIYIINCRKSRFSIFIELMLCNMCVACGAIFYLDYFGGRFAKLQKCSKICYNLC